MSEKCNVFLEGDEGSGCSSTVYQVEVSKMSKDDLSVQEGNAIKKSKLQDCSCCQLIYRPMHVMLKTCLFV